MNCAYGLYCLDMLDKLLLNVLNLVSSWQKFAFEEVKAEADNIYSNASFTVISQVSSDKKLAAIARGESREDAYSSIM